MTDHPIRRPDVQAEVERVTREQILLRGGSGRVVVEFDFNRGKAVCYTVTGRGGRRDLSPLTGAETAVG